MRVYLPYMDEKTVDGAFCRGLLLVHDGKFDDALQVLDMARDLMYTEVSALVGESYERAYKSVVKAQQVAELEEVIMYRQSYERADGVEHREHLRQMWGGALPRRAPARQQPGLAQVCGTVQKHQEIQPERKGAFDIARRRRKEKPA
jgi:hypothetical protein